MDQPRFDQSMKILAGSAGRRDAVRSLGAVGAALLSGLGFAGASTAARKDTNPGGNGGGNDRNRRGKRQPPAQNGTVQAERKKKKCKKPCPVDSGGSTRLVISAPSDPLPVTAGSSVVASADCGGISTVVSRGYQMSATPEQLVNVFVIDLGTTNDGLSRCDAALRRTAEVGSTAGAQIIARAVCRT